MTSSPFLTPYYGDCIPDNTKAPRGRFLLPKGATLRVTDWSWNSNGSPTPTDYPGHAVAGENSTRCPYSRAISDDPTLYAAMQVEALKAQTPTLLARTEELTTQVASLKAELDRLRDAHRPIQAGDWVVCLNDSPPLSGRDKTPVVLGQLYQAERVRPNGYDLVGLPDDTHVWNPMRFRRATPAEVSAHLASQHAKVGDWVYCVENVTSNSLTSRVRRDDTYAVRAVGPKGYQLTRPEAGDTYWGFRSFRTPTPDELNRHLLALETKAATEAVAAKAAAKAVAEMGAKLVTITVDGVDYVSDYRGGAVLFGCAKINNDLIRRAHNLLHHAPQAPVVWGTWGNRSIEGVLIGKGLFTKVDLAKLVSNLID